MTNDLVEIEKIKRVYAALCDAMDYRDFDQLAVVYTPDCQVDYDEICPGLCVEGSSAVVAAARSLLAEATIVGATLHMVSNFRIDVHGDNADAKARFHAVHVGAGEWAGQLFQCWGDYEDRFVKRGDLWQIAHRTYHSFAAEGPPEIAGYKAPARWA